MKFGLRYASLGKYSNGPAAVELAQAAEAAGFDSIWTVEHVVVPHAYQSRYPYSPTGRMGSGLEDFPIPDPLIWLAYVASATRTLKLGTAILILPQRNPVVTAKAVATLDHLAGGGRVLLGIGVGWLAEEFATLGRAVRGPRAAHRRVRGGDARAVEPGVRELPRALRLVRQGLLPAPAAGAPHPHHRRRRHPWPRLGEPAASATATSRPAAPAAELFDEMRRAAEAAGREPGRDRDHRGRPDRARRDRGAGPGGRDARGRAGQRRRPGCPPRSRHRTTCCGTART